MLTLTALYWRRPPVLRRGYEPGVGLTVAIQRFQSDRRASWQSPLLS
jgi:hypothetical protein